MTGLVLALNAGSSSIKFALFAAIPGGVEPVGRGQIDGIGTAPAVRIAGEDAPREQWPAGTALHHEDFLGRIFDWAETERHGRPLLAIGHRIVHGGTGYAAPTRLDDATIAALDELSPLAPLHQPHNLAAVRAARAVRPDVPQIGCFDTAFHRTMSDLATRFALPRALHDAGIRRYGFHGLSYEFLARQLRSLDPERAGGRILLVHLGNGSSLCAIHGGHSVGTTMGFTALDGLMMGSRCGAIDPGVVLHLIEQRGMAPAEVAHLLSHDSGLLGVSGESSDMRVLLASDTAAAAEAVDLFCLIVVRHAGALIAEMGGLEGIVFSAGIGEHAAPVRARIAQRLGWAGVTLDPAANEAHAPLISSAESPTWVRIIPTDEERMIAKHCLETLGLETLVAADSRESAA